MDHPVTPTRTIADVASSLAELLREGTARGPGDEHALAHKLFSSDGVHVAWRWAVEAPDGVLRPVTDWASVDAEQSLLRGLVHLECAEHMEPFTLAEELLPYFAALRIAFVAYESAVHGTGESDGGDALAALAGPLAEPVVTYFLGFAAAQAQKRALAAIEASAALLQLGLPHRFVQVAGAPRMLPEIDAVDLRNLDASALTHTLVGAHGADGLRVRDDGALPGALVRSFVLRGNREDRRHHALAIAAVDAEHAFDDYVHLIEAPIPGEGESPERRAAWCRLNATRVDVEVLAAQLGELSQVWRLLLIRTRDETHSALSSALLQAMRP